MIDKLLTQSVQKVVIPFKTVFKIGFFTLTLIAFLKIRLFQFLWQSIFLVFICTKFIRDVLGSCTSSTILSKKSDGANLTILNICWTSFHSLRWMLTTHLCNPKHVQEFFSIKFSQFSQHNEHCSQDMQIYTQ